MKKKLNLLWNLKFNFFSVAERPLTFFAYFLNAKKVGRRRLVIVPATAGGLPLFSHAASCSRPGGGNDRPSGFAQRNGAEQRQAPGCERGASRGTKERTPADPAGKCGATFEQSENGAASTLPPAGATTGQRGFAQAKWSRTATSAGYSEGGFYEGSF